MRTHFFTGYPGFLGSELLPRILQDDPGSTAVCLVQQKFAAMARERSEPLGARVRLVEGDITTPGLGLDAALAGELTSIHHLAAIYDLSVKRDGGMRINVDGTRHVVEFAQSCPRLERFHYVSTCYVSGAHPGVFRETDLDVGQRFNNYYEETKFLAEVEVQKAMREGLPVTIYRPAIVVGDSVTGETQKFDGPYFFIRWLLRQPTKYAVVPLVGDPKRTFLNVVPRDFIAASIPYLAKLGTSNGKVYQLADPEPLTIAKMMGALARATGKRLVPIPLPRGLAKFAINRVPGVYLLMQIPAALVDYMVLPTTYDTTNASADLADSGIAVPSFRSYVDKLVAFMASHREIGSDAMA
jgi:nucleoside-diphosphate-sugar epimerase